LASNDETNEAGISSLFNDARDKLDGINKEAKKEKKQVIIQLAKDLDGKIPTDTISIEIVNQLRGKVSERFIRKCLDEKYKQNHRAENARKQRKRQQQVCNENHLAALVPPNQEAEKEVITIDVDGREETAVPSPSSEPVMSGTHTREGNVPSCHTQRSQTIVKPENRECDRCKIHGQKIDELEEKVQHYEKIIEDLPIKTADQIISAETYSRETNQHVNNPTSPSGNEVVMDCECSIPWPVMQRYVQHIYKSGKPLEARFNFRFNKQTATVIAAYPGRIAERNRIGAFSQQVDLH
jgi:hypothetical protein